MMILYLVSVRGEGVFDYRRVVELLQGHRVEFLLQLGHLLPVLLVEAVHHLLAALPRGQQLLPPSLGLLLFLKVQLGLEDRLLHGGAEVILHGNLQAWVDNFFKKSKTSEKVLLEIEAF